MDDHKLNMIEFDIRGQICPSSLLTALREVNNHKKALKRGDAQLVILTDNRDSTTTIPDSIRNMGYDVQVDKDHDSYRILIEKHTSKR